MSRNEGGHMLMDKTPSYPVNLVLPAAAILLYPVPHAVLLASYCGEVGCFMPGCTDVEPHQCLPPMSDTYIVWEETPTMYARWTFMLIVCGVRTIIVPFLESQTYQRMAEDSGRAYAKCCSTACRVTVIVQAVLDVLSVLFWNKAPFKTAHQTLSQLLISTWIIYGPLWVWALWGEKQEPLRSKSGALFIVGCAVIGFLVSAKLALDFQSADWHWYAWEWLDIETMSAGQIVGTICLPSTIRLVRSTAPGGGCTWKVVRSETS
eukprot:CAMPEP_0175440736 /NCGR_PEP_ID=MMETSP0095-20121207/57226_1 /TAXON_ID=311494 /ORGANISM="Alexandrium monilatum, Strain CCMP3105" /LENGTH=262 /DNA_ID=CAMNT_0016740623 /DNA_START=8 /DNA_END=793 /DNA_ORIENTATION=-